jgi:hypothetical protein
MPKLAVMNFARAFPGNHVFLPPNMMLAEKQEGRSRRITVGADKAYDTKDFVSTVRELKVTPHVTKNDKGPFRKG